MRSLLLVAFVCAIALPALADQSLYSNGYFADRSGDIIVKPNQQSTLSVKAVFSAQYPAKSSVLDTDVASSIASVLAIAGAAPADLLARPAKAHLTFVVNDLPLENAVKVQATQLPAASSRAATLASLLTGRTASAHGIVADAWYSSNGKNKKTAFATVAEYPLFSQVQDVVALTNEQNGAKQAVVVSASSSPLLARALGVRPELRARLGEATAVLEFNSGAFEATAISAGLLPAQARKILAKEFPQVTLFEGAVFDALYSELAFGLHFIRSVEVAARPMTDGALDALSVGVDGLSGVLREFGKSSEEYTASVTLVNAALQRVIAKATAFYGAGAVSSVIISMSGCPAAAAQRADSLPASVQSRLSALAFPHLYVAEDSVRAALCAELVAAGVDVVCSEAKKRAVTAAPEEAPVQAPMDAPLDAPVSVPVAAPSNGTDAPTNVTAPVAPPSPLSPADVAMFQVVLWSSILMGAAIIAVIASFCMIGPDEELSRITAMPGPGRNAGKA